MTTDINKIYLDTTLTVESSYSNTLCFVDGRLIDKSRYVLDNHELNLYNDASEYVSLFYDLNVTKSYYFERNLSDYGTVINGADEREAVLSGMRSGNVMIFVDGVLIRKEEYTILDQESVALLLIRNDTKFHKIIIVVSKTDLQYGVLSDPLNIHGRDGTDTTNGIYVTVKGIMPGDWDLNTLYNSVWTDNNNLQWKLKEINPWGPSTAPDTIQVEGIQIKFGRGNGNNGMEKDTPLPEILSCPDFDLELEVLPEYYQEEDGYIISETWETLDSSEEYNNPENKIGYNRYTTLIFRNGKLISTDNIKTNAYGYTFIEFNPLPSDKFEYYKLNSKTTSYNFTATPGITTYGDRDDYHDRLPLLYDSTVLLGDLARVVIDDLRPGFIICEKDRAGRLMIVDETDESARLKVLTIHEFSKADYGPDEYYLEVPEARSIVNYLSEYEHNFQMLPEILKVFQRVILDEIHDEVERIRNIRCSTKVDSAHVHKLLRLLGMNLDIKHLTIKQLQEAIDELTNFYRVSGTKHSLNYFNIVQDNTKLIRMQQLFTYHKQQRKDNSKKVYTYTYDFFGDLHGEGYRQGEKYRLVDYYNSPVGIDTGIVVNIDEVGEYDGKTNAVLEFTPDKYEGSQGFEGIPLTLVTNSVGATVDVKSVPYIYDYSVTIPRESDTGGHQVGEVLTSPLFDGKIIVDSVDDSDPARPHLIDGFHVEPSSGTTSYVNIVDSPLQIQTSSVTLQLIITAVDKSKEIVYKTINGEFDSRRNGGNRTGTFSVKVDETAEYEIIMSGGGGSGGAADTTVGSTNDSPAGSGYSGEEIVKRIACVAGSYITCNIGQGGKPSYARGHGPCYCGAGGAGADNGKMGFNRSESFNNRQKERYWYHNYWWSSFETYYVNGSARWGGETVTSRAASGAGGGSSSFTYNGHTFIAKGGDGGTATWAGKNTKHSSANDVLLQGGQGGSGGTKVGSGAYGGVRNPNDSSFTSGAGKDGYIIIRKVTQDYATNAKLGNNSGIGVPLNTIYKTTNNMFEVTVNEIVEGVITDFTVTPEYGKAPVFVENSNGEIVSHTKTYDLINTTISASFTLTQSVNTYTYTTLLNKPGSNYMTNQVLKSEDETISLTVTSVDDNGRIKTFNYSPKQGHNFLEYYNLPLNNTTYGRDARIQISANTDVPIQNIEREYVDFYTIEELFPDAYRKEYRFPITDYGYVNQGSPNSPWPWTPGLPDIDYGTTTEGTPNAPYPDTEVDHEHVTVRDETGKIAYEKDIRTLDPIGLPDIDYGYVKDRIKGEWVEWWDFERPSDLYPTNHVEIEINVLSNEDYDKAVSRFYTQFYQLASAVLYIHRLITTYNMGNNIATGITADNPNGGDGRIFMGIMTTQPYVEQVYTLTNDPSRQPDMSGIDWHRDCLQHVENFYLTASEAIAAGDVQSITYKGRVLNENNLPTSDLEDGDLYYIGEYSNTPPAGMVIGQCGIAIWSESNSSWIFGNDDLDKTYIMDHFMPTIGEFRTKDFCEYYNISLNSAEIIIRELKQEPGPTPPVPPTPVDEWNLGGIEENVDTIVDLGLVEDPVTETQDLGNI